MKHIITSAGLLAVGLSGLQAANDSFLTNIEKSKAWNVSAALRGFYDSNPTYAPYTSAQTGTWGMSVIPNFTLNLPVTDQTYVGVGVQYTLNYYAEEVFSKHYDQSVQAIFKVNHKFSDRYRIRFSDTFAYSNQPQILSAGTPIATAADAIRNVAPITFNGELTERIGFELGYQNNIVNYFDSGAGSYRALLNRMENMVHLDGRYNVTETLTGLVGYQFSATDYNGNELLYTTGSPLTSDYRNFNSHYMYLGGEWNATRDLVLGLKAGAQYSNYENAGQTDWTPYVDLSGTYTYLPNSYVRLGFKSIVASTDVTGTGTRFTTALSQQLLLLYAQWTHQITAKLSGTLTGQFQNSTFEGANPTILTPNSPVDQTENLYSFNAFLSYAFNPHLSTEAGYSYYGLVSDVTYTARGFNRNYVYLGFRGTY